MYTYEQAREGHQWFRNTGVEYKGKLVYVNNCDAGFSYSTWNNKTGWTAIVEPEPEAPINWSPRFATGYHNVHMRSGAGTIWATTSGRRQYKVGISQGSVFGRCVSIADLGAPTQSSMQTLVQAYNSPRIMPTSVDQARDFLTAGVVAGTPAVGLSPTIGLHAYTKSARRSQILIVQNSKWAIGVLDGDTLVVDDTLQDVILPNYAQVQYAKASDILTSFREA